MPSIQQNIEHLAKEIGPRPAGTEEEQKAALYIADSLQRDCGLPSAVEEFNGMNEPDTYRMVLSGAAALFAVLGLVVPALGIVCVIATLAAAALTAAERFDKPVLSKFLGHGVSQNVIAKYAPESSSDSNVKKRKIVVVAHYDSAKMKPELSGSFPQFLGKAYKASFIASIALPFLLLFRCVVLYGSTGFFPSLFSILTMLAALLAAIPLVIGILHKTSQYNEAANNNASGVAALMEIAAQIGNGRMSEGEIAQMQDAQMHGEEAAREAGLIPDGAEVAYHTGEQIDENAGGAEGLATAKAAIAALSGKPVSGMSEEDVARNLSKLQEEEALDKQAEQPAAVENFDTFSEPNGLQESESAGESVQVNQDAESVQPNAGQPAQQQQVAAQPAAPVVETTANATPVQAESGVPDWFKKAQSKAKKPKPSNKPQYRSRFASALDEVDASLSASQASEPAQPAAKQAPQAVEQAQEQPKAAVQQVEHATKAAAEQPEHDVDVSQDVHAPKWNTSKQNESAKTSSVKEKPESTNTSAAKKPKANAKSEQSKKAEQGKETDVSTKEPEQQTQQRSESNASATKPMESVSETGRIVIDGDAVLKKDVTDTEKAAQESIMNLGAGAEKREKPTTSNENDKEATIATPVIDVTKLNLDDVPVAKDVPMPKFLEEEQKGVLTDAEIGASAESTDGENAEAETEDVTPAPAWNIPSMHVKPAKTVDEKISYRQVQNSNAEGDVESGEGTSAAAYDNSGRKLVGTDPSRSATLPVVLPEVRSAQPKGTKAAVASKQRAPLADVESQSKVAAKSLLQTLPTIGTSDIVTQQESLDGKSSEDAPKHASTQDAAENKNPLLATLPSLSGAIKAADIAKQNPSLSGTIAPVDSPGASGLFAPVTGELVSEAANSEQGEEDIYVDDVDDSAYGSEFTETGAYAGEGYVEMPKSKIRSFFDKFRRNKETEVEFESDEFYEDYEEEDFESSAPAGSYDDATQAFAPVDTSGLYQEQQGVVPGDESGAEYSEDDYAGEANENYEYVDDDDYCSNYEDEFEEKPRKRGFFRKWHGGAFSPRVTETVSTKSQDVASEAATAAEEIVVPEEVNKEVDEIYKFRNPNINADVWCVVLGAEMAENAGMKAFLEQHSNELRGAFIIQLDGIGAGELSVIEKEGVIKQAKTSSRIKRYTRKASQKTGIKLGTQTIEWAESASSYAIKHGMQAVHIAGIEGGKQALLGQQDDVCENVSTKKVQQAVNFVMEVIKSV